VKNETTQPQRAAALASELVSRAFGSRVSPAASEPASDSPATDNPGRYDFDLAEFPLFRYERRRVSSKDRTPIVYTDTIVGKDGEAIQREWKCYPGAFGFGGATAQQLLYELLQLYVDQGCRGSQIQFGTPRALLLRIWPETRNPSRTDYARLRRDLDILRGYDFHCRNAFWDRAKQAYVDMHWRLFGDICFFKPRPDGLGQQELPFGFIEASRVLQQIARTRGFFCLGFGSELFRSLKPLEQRLAVYLSKKFVSQSVHRRFVKDLARALPIEAARPDNVRRILTGVAEGLLSRGVPTLQGYHYEKSRRTGESLIVFERGVRPKQRQHSPKGTGLLLHPETAVLVDDIVEQIGSRDDVLWWTKCAEILGPDIVYQGLSQMRDAAQSHRIRSRGAFLTKIFKDLARVHKLAIA
jgi:hypothetical protein